MTVRIIANAITTAATTMTIPHLVNHGAFAESSKMIRRIFSTAVSRASGENSETTIYVVPPIVRLQVREVRASLVGVCFSRTGTRGLLEVKNQTILHAQCAAIKASGGGNASVSDGFVSPI